MERRVVHVNRLPPDDVRRDRLEVLMSMGRSIPCAVRNVLQDRLDAAWLTPLQATGSIAATGGAAGSSRGRP